jgi:hypothetical protein
VIGILILTCLTLAIEAEAKSQNPLAEAFQSHLNSATSGANLCRSESSPPSNQVMQFCDSPYRYICERPKVSTAERQTAEDQVRRMILDRTYKERFSSLDGGSRPKIH